MDSIQSIGYCTVFSFVFGRVDIGTIDSIASAFSTLFIGLAPLLFGITKDLTGSFDLILLITMILCCIMVPVLALSKNPDPPARSKSIS